jgi:hypothetical protein
VTHQELGRLADLVTPDQIDDMQHALGGRSNHRNYYVTSGNGDDHARWTLLEGIGLAERGEAKGWIPGAVFHVTDLGRRVLRIVEAT